MKMQIFLYERGTILTAAQKKWLTWSLAVGWMIVIFLFSAQQAGESAKLSGGVLKYLIGAVSAFIPSDEINQDLIHFFVRKGAHFGVYGVLGLLVANAVYTTRGKWDVKTTILIIFICMFYAATDEIHQIFVPGRAGMLQDVLIDTLGASAGCLLFWFLTRAYNVAH